MFEASGGDGPDAQLFLNIKKIRSHARTQKQDELTLSKADRENCLGNAQVGVCGRRESTSSPVSANFLLTMT